MRIVTTASPSAPPTEFPLETRTAPALWRYALAQEWTTPAYLEEQADGWREVSWQEAGERVDALARALLAHDVRKGEAVAVLSRTRLEWLLLDWAIMSIGAVVVGLYPTNTPPSAGTSSTIPRQCWPSPRTTSSRRSSRPSSTGPCCDSTSWTRSSPP